MSALSRDIHVYKHKLFYILSLYTLENFGNLYAEHDTIVMLIEKKINIDKTFLEIGHKTYKVGRKKTIIVSALVFV